MVPLQLISCLLLLLLLASGCAKPPEEKSIRQSKDIMEIVLEGVVQPSQEQPLIAPLSERITAVSVKNGRKVARGQVIMEYDASSIRSDYRKALAEYEKKKISSKHYSPRYDGNRELLASARERVQKTYELYKGNSASLSELKSAEDAYLSILHSELNAERSRKKEEFDTAKSRDEAAKEVEKARLDLEKARSRLAHAALSAPIEGHVTDIRVTPGRNVSDGEVLGKIMNIDTVVLKGAFSPGIYGYLRENMTVDISCLTAPPFTTKGKVQEITPVIDSESKRMSLYVPIENRGYLLQPGDKCLITIVLPREKAEKGGIDTDADTVHIKSGIK
jgi:multidrug efflux pump subunit AcrA (membrane-fusion protein)